jgi:ABC-type multidrug transport system fused ATPase/permease subunit
MNAIPREDEADELGRDEHSIQVQDGGSEVELATIQSLNIESADNNALVVLNLGARYRVDLAPVLRDVSFVIKAREKVAIIGRTGSGKTSLI